MIYSMKEFQVTVFLLVVFIFFSCIHYESKAAVPEWPGAIIDREVKQVLNKELTKLPWMICQIRYKHKGVNLRYPTVGRGVGFLHAYVSPYKRPQPFFKLYTGSMSLKRIKTSEIAFSKLGPWIHASQCKLIDGVSGR